MKRADITDRMVCEAVRDWRAGRHDGFITDLMVERHGAPLKVIYAALDRADDRGLIDFGVSLRTAWLTDKGEALISA